MTTIVTRAGKGSPLTNAELDANFQNLNSAKLEAGDLSPYLLSATAASTYQTIAGMSSYLTTANAASTYLTQANAASTYQTTLVSGTSIKTVNGQSVLGSGNIQIDGGVTSFNTRTGAVTLSSSDVTTALGFTPYNSTNPSGYITSSALSPYLLSATAASTYLPLAGGTLTGNLSFNGSGLRITGDFSGASTSRLLLQTSTTNGQTLVTAIPNGTGVDSQFQAYNSSNPNNSSIAALVASATQVRIVSGSIGTGTVNPITFIFSNTEAARFDPTTRNFLIGTSTDNGTDKLQVNGSVSATSFKGTLDGGTLIAYQEKVQVVGTVSTATYNINLSLANIFDITLGANVTFTFTNAPASNFSKPTTIILRQDATGNRTASFTNAKYTDGATPILSTGANQVDVLTFFTVNGGSFWFGTFAMANVS